MKPKICYAIVIALISLSIMPGLNVSAGVNNSHEVSKASEKYSLKFNLKNFTIKTLTINNKTVKFRAYEKIVYVKNPVDTTYQIMNIYIPIEYFMGKSVGSYNAKTAPIFFPNSVGGYMPGAPGTLGNKNTPAPFPGATGLAPGAGAPDGGAGAASVALSKGYIVAMPGARGRTTQNATGEYTGKAPAAIVDLKAAVRYLRYNDKLMPGNAERIISNGTSAGGALSALLGATGNSKDYEPYLKALGAANVRDDIFASSDYCPITNLDKADMAYEWIFNGVNDYKSMSIAKVGDQMVRSEVPGTMTTDQIKLSKELKKQFSSYVNGLKLKAEDGTLLTLDEDGNGTFKEAVKASVIQSAQKALGAGTDLSKITWLKIENGKVVDIDFFQYAQYVGRMKTAPAFDGVDLSSGENDEFGTATIKAQHFTEYGKANSVAANATLADSKIVEMMNPMGYIGAKGVKTAPYWRIRYGSIDNNTSLAIETILATKLENAGYKVDFAVPWGVGHAGDYDLEELFAWTDSICKVKK